MKLIYLASPHASGDPYIRNMRYELVMRAWNILFRSGELAISPILHTHAVALSYHNVEDRVFQKYQRLDEEIISRCDVIYVLCIEGWIASKGINSEIAYAKKIGKEIRYFRFDFDSQGHPSDYLIEEE